MRGSLNVVAIERIVFPRGTTCRNFSRASDLYETSKMDPSIFSVNIIHAMQKMEAFLRNYSAQDADFIGRYDHAEWEQYYSCRMTQDEHDTFWLQAACVLSCKFWTPLEEMTVKSRGDPIHQPIAEF